MNTSHSGVADSPSKETVDSSRITWKTTVRVTAPSRFRPTHGGRRLNSRCAGEALAKHS